MLNRHGLLAPLALFSLTFVTGCGASEIVQKFDGLAGEQCGCGDAACAKEVHGKFTKAWDEMKSADIDWGSDQGKMDTKGIEDATKKYTECLNKQTSSEEATATCQADEEAKASTEACTACCVKEGRFFQSWVDPLAAGLAGAFGAGDVPGCTCK